MSEHWRSRSHAIGEKAQSVFEGAISDDWAAVKQTPDYGVDYRVEVFEKGEKTGNIFGVQLKGSTTLAPQATTWKLRLKTKHLAAFLDKERQPIFVVLVDTINKKGRWLFVQQYVTEQLDAKKWRKKQSAQLLFPTSNDIADSDAFAAKVAEAFEYVRHLWPGGLRATIDYEQQRLEALDPRFEVKVTASEDNTHCQIYAKQNVTLTIKIDGPENISRLRDLIESGIPAEFASRDVQVKGSPLFESFSDGTMKIAPHVHLGDLTISAIEKDDDRVLLTMPATLRFGASRGLLAAKLPNGPLTFEVDLHDKKGEPLNARLSAPLKKWFGQALGNLAHFDGFRRLIFAIETGVDLRVGFSVPGAFSLSLRTNATQLSEMRKYTTAVDGLNKARWIAKELSINASLDHSHFDHEWNDVFELYELLKNDGVPRPAPRQHLTFTMPREETSMFLAPTPQNHDRGHFKRVSSWEYWFFGHTVEILDLAHECTEMAIDRDAAISQLSNPKNDRIRLSFHGTDTSTQLTRIDRNRITVRPAE